jgi:hypothetical protein
VVSLQAELESFKAQAQGYKDGSLTSNPQKESCERLTPCMQDGQLFFHQTMASNSSVKSESSYTLQMTVSIQSQLNILKVMSQIYACPTTTTAILLAT